MTQHEHILKLPDVYIGSVEFDEHDMWVFDDAKNCIVNKRIKFNPGLYKIFDEILVNARDHTVNNKNCTRIDVTVDKLQGKIVIENNGSGIPIERHKQYKIYIPELIFGHLLTSSNYETKKKTVGGKNGLGAKLACIFSNKFIIETVDEKRGLKYTQEFTRNMFEKTEPDIQKTGNKGMTRISFFPDLKRFSMEKLDTAILSLFKKRVYDIAACTKVNVTYNKKRVPIKDFKDYIRLFTDSKFLSYQETKRWSVGVVFQQGSKDLSYVNGICTYNGGTHVTHVVSQIVESVITQIQKTAKDLKITPKIVKDNILVFINCVIEDPSFNSQTKDTLTTRMTKFGSKFVLGPKTLDNLFRSGIIDLIIGQARAKEINVMKKTDGKKVDSLREFVKLEDAIWAGTGKSSETFLILTEGDSAKTFAMYGRSIIGPERCGVFPLRGKLLNVRDATLKKVANNLEITSLKQIIGLKIGNVYNSTKGLRYGKIIILTDQDMDGSHIKGLIMNFLHFFWQSLVELNTFIQCLRTPLVKAIKGKNELKFYTMSEYKKWEKKTNAKGYEIKYYKGLGRSTPREAKEAFSDFNENLISYNWDKDKGKPMELAFGKQMADDRKDWLKDYDKDSILPNKSIITINEFVNKELIHFSNYDNIRSIPGIDGFKPSQRKIIYACFLKGLDKKKAEIKVMQLSAYIAEKAVYHHGEVSLQGAIVKMAQTFVGTNNLNLLVPNGNFGTRREGGKDSSSPRYIYTRLSELCPFIFRKEDDCVLDWTYDEGTRCEPVLYPTILPISLINGAKGIGTGFSTDIPSYDPIDIVKNLRRLLRKKQQIAMKPYFRKFKGKVISINGKYYTEGVYKLDKSSVHIKELPIGTWTTNYKSEILKKIETPDSGIIGIIDKSDNNNIDILIRLDSSGAYKFHDEPSKVIDSLGLRKPIPLTNMHLYNRDSKITRYEGSDEILLDFFKFRLEMYKDRKYLYTKELARQRDIALSKKNYILDIINNKLEVRNKRKKSIEEALSQANYTKYNDSYDYLLNMPISCLTREKVDELEELYQSKETEYISYKELSPRDLWENELLEFEDAYKKWISNDTE